MRTHNIGVVSSIPPCVTLKAPFMRKATENHIMNSTSLEKTQSPVSGFCYARNRVCNALKFQFFIFGGRSEVDFTCLCLLSEKETTGTLMACEKLLVRLVQLCLYIFNICKDLKGVASTLALCLCSCDQDLGGL